MLDEVVMSVGQPAAPPPSLARSLVVVVMKGWGWGLLRLLWGLVSHSALPNSWWMIFKTQRVFMHLSLSPFLQYVSESESLSSSSL